MYDFIDFENFQVVCKECQKKSILIKEESLLGNGTDLKKKVILTFKCPILKYLPLIINTYSRVKQTRMLSASKIGYPISTNRDIA